MATQITNTSELQAINTILSIIGEAPVSSITTNIGSDVSIAKQILDESSVTVQSKGWNFNTEESFSLAIDSNKISCKATTTAGLGFEGNLEGVSCHCISLIE